MPTDSISAGPDATRPDERPVSERTLDEAIAWQLLLDSGDATEDDRATLADWLCADPAHARAWRQLGQLDENLRSLAPARTPAVRSALARTRRLPRAGSVIRGLALLGAVALGLIALDRHKPVSGLLADYRTGTGERRELVLSDGTQVVLNTRSAIDVTFDADTRAITLRSGEILVRTAATDDPRPLVVFTEHGSMRALGTRFIVRYRDTATTLVVTEAAVLARPETCAAATQTTCKREARVEAGHGVELQRDSVGSPWQASPDVEAWQEGMLVVDDVPLGHVVDELARYRRGFVTVAPEAAAQRVSGTVSLTDTELALDALTHALPVRIDRRTALWTHIEVAEER